MNKRVIILLVVICLLVTGCKKKDLKTESNYLVCTSQIKETNNDIGTSSHKIIIDFTKDIESTMYIYLDLLESYDKESTKELIQKKVCIEDYKSCETSIDNNRITITISGTLEQILVTDKYREYLDIKKYLLDNNYKCEE